MTPIRGGGLFDSGTSASTQLSVDVSRWMMAQLVVRGLEEELVARLNVRAAENGRSSEAEHREILRQALEDPARRASFRELAARVRAMTAGRRHTPAEMLLREGRAER